MVKLSICNVGKKKKEWASFQNWLKKWNRIMALVFSALFIILMLAVVIVNALDVYEDSLRGDEEEYENQQRQQPISIQTKNDDSCYWLASNECGLQCFSAVSSEISFVLENLWNEKPECHESGLLVELRDLTATNTNRNLPSGWFTAKIKMYELIIGASQLNDIDDGAFISDTFAKLETLTFRSPGFTFLNSQAFIGLYSLKELHFELSSIRGFQSNFLNPVAKTLSSLSLVQNTRFNGAIIIDGLTGGDESALHLTNVKIEFNLTHTISSRSFRGLSGVINLDLSYCQIIVIGTRAFDPISETIQSLDLRNNRLATFQPGLFDFMSVRDNFRVLVTTNDWVCDCDLCYFQWMLKNDYKFDGVIECRQPFEMRGQPIRDTHFCFDVNDNSCNGNYVPEPPSTTTTTTSSTTTSITTTLATNTTYRDDENEDNDPGNHPPSDKFEQVCYTDKSENTFITFYYSKFNFKIIELSPTEIYIEINPTINQGHILVWQNQNYILGIDGDEIKCHIFNKEINKQFLITDLLPDTVYLFCIINETLELISPFDCISYKMPISYDNVWLMNDEKTLMICLLLIGIIFSIFFGFILGYCLIWMNPNCLRGSRNVVIIGNARDTKTQTQRQIPLSPNKIINTDKFTTRKLPEQSNYYATAVNPTRFDVIQQRLRRAEENHCETRGEYEDRQYLERAPYIRAPPAPPAVPQQLNISSENNKTIQKPLAPSAELPYVMTSASGDILGNAEDQKEDNDPDAEYACVDINYKTF